MSKYNSIKTVFDGIKFDSNFESEVYAYLKLLEKSGKIAILGLQPKIYLTESRILYKPDFHVYDNEIQKEFYIDAKGMRTAVFQIKKRLWKKYGPSHLDIYEKKRGQPVLSERVEIDNGTKFSKSNRGIS